MKAPSDPIDRPALFCETYRLMLVIVAAFSDAM